MKIMILAGAGSDSLFYRLSLHGNFAHVSFSLSKLDNKRILGVQFISCLNGPLVISLDLDIWLDFFQSYVDLRYSGRRHHDGRKSEA